MAPPNDRVAVASSHQPGPVAGGISAVVPVDLVMSGCPPTPAQLLQGLLPLIEGQCRLAAKRTNDRPANDFAHAPTYARAGDT